MIDATLKRTPLNALHREAGAKLVPFAGWEMPLHYGSQREEHVATRTGCGLFDVSHMGQIEVTGPEAPALVQLLVTNDVSRLGDGEECYTALCRADGGMLDDLFVARRAADRWLLVVNAATREADLAHMQGLADVPGLDAELRDAGDAFAMIAVQGPRWREVTAGALDAGPWAELPRNRIVELTWRGRPLLLSTTGYTGEAGCELLAPSEAAPQLWRALATAGARPVGLAARDSLRLEAGYLLSGQDFTTAHNPLEAGIGWTVKLDKGEFHGRAALDEVRRRGPARRLVGLLPDGRRIPRHGMAVLAGDRIVGEVTSGIQSITLGRPIALAYVATKHAGPGNALEVDLGRTRLPVRITRPKFYPAGD